MTGQSISPLASTGFRIHTCAVHRLGNRVSESASMGRQFSAVRSSSQFIMQ